MGLIGLLFSDPFLFAIVAVIIILAITIHEFAHAWMADRLGDPTPRYQGRVTVNPLAHLDPLGTALLFLVGFGWGKPVEFDPHNLKEPVRDAALVALAGPVSNLIMALLIAILIPAVSIYFSVPIDVARDILNLGVFYNCMLAIFNLVPVHPLDGSKILMALLPRRTALEYEHFMYRYGTIVLIALVFPFGGRPPISWLITPVINVLVALYLDIAQTVATILL
jgi:Zn-dependent protease